MSQRIILPTLRLLLGTELLLDMVICLKRLITAAFGSFEQFRMMGMSAPSLHRESTDSLIIFVQVCNTVFRAYGNRLCTTTGKHICSIKCLLKNFHLAKEYGNTARYRDDLFNSTFSMEIQIYPPERTIESVIVVSHLDTIFTIDAWEDQRLRAGL